MGINRRAHRRQGGAPSFDGNFGALFTGVLQYLRSDLGLSTTGPIVNAWADQSGNGVHVTEASAGVGLGTVTTGLTGHAGIAGGLGGQFGLYTLDLPAPGTTPIFYWGVARLLTSPGAQGWLMGDTAIVYANAGANMTIYNGVATLGTPAAVGSWGRFEAQFTNTAADYVRFGAAASPSGNPGNSNPGGTRSLFAISGGGAPGNWELLTLVTMNNVPAGPTLAAASAAAQAFYGGTVAV